MNALIKFFTNDYEVWILLEKKEIARGFYCILFDIPLAFWVLVRTHMM